MRRLWRDIKGHPLSTALFLIYWLAIWGAHRSLGWDNGIPPVGMILHFSAPTIAGGLVGWWRGSTKDSGGPLAAALVTVIGMMFIFAPGALDDIRSGQANAGAWLFEVIISWAVASVIFGLFGGALGSLGAFVGKALSRE